jgi:N-methylhydantoinase B
MSTNVEETLYEANGQARIAETSSVLDYFSPSNDDALDPVTFEIISHKFAQLTTELATTIQRTSGSVIVNEAGDFNVSLADELGQLFNVGDYAVVHGTALQDAIEWTLEHRADNPGIEEGDMFLLSDPWVGVVHQPDVALLAPIFVDRMLFAWAACTMHMLDTGGAMAGGLNTAATDAFSEPAPTPPIKLVRGSVLQRDVEEMFVRRSRLPQLLALDLRAMIATNQVAATRLREIAAVYSPSVVHRVIKRELDNAEAEFRARLRELPDGRWSDVQLCEVAGDGDRRVHAVRGTMVKQGDELEFDVTATDEQAGFFNSTWPATKGGLAAAILPLVGPDLTWAPGGALRAVKFKYKLGTIVAAEFPAAVSAGPISGGLVGATLATVLLTKMLSSAAPELKKNLLSVTAACMPINSYRGLDDRGQFVLVLNIELVPGGTGARSWRDGDHYSGTMLGPAAKIPNIEHQEHHYPLLWLYRRELPDSAGAGRFRGGVGGESAVIPYGASMGLEMLLAAHGVAMPSSRGLNGGLPAPALRFRVFRERDVLGAFAAGRMPTTDEELGGDPEWPHPKLVNMALGPNDVFASSGAGGGGYGDPLDRDPALVADDVTEGYLSPEFARSIYGVVLSGTEPDAEASTALRAVLRGARIGKGPTAAPELRTPPHGSSMLSENVVLTAAGDAICARCSTTLSEASQDFKSGALVSDMDMAALGLIWVDPKTFVDTPFALRSFCCPECGTLLETDIQLEDESHTCDRELFGLSGA